MKARFLAWTCGCMLVSISQVREYRKRNTDVIAVLFLQDLFSYNFYIVDNSCGVVFKSSVE